MFKMFKRIVVAKVSISHLLQLYLFTVFGHRWSLRET